MKDGKPLPLKDVEIVVGEDKVTYKIKKPQRESSGIYQIKIGNNQGEEVKDVNIVMQGLYFCETELSIKSHVLFLNKELDHYMNKSNNNYLSFSSYL